MTLLRRHYWKALFLLCVALFQFFPNIDIAFTNLFFRDGEGFFLKQTLLPQWTYRCINNVSDPLLYGLIAAFLASTTVLHDKLAGHRAPLGFLLLVLLLGPGLVVNVLLKNEIGRARPDRIVEFGGTQTFSPPFVPAAECASNCAFVSGHAAFGYFPVAVGFAYPRRRRWWFAAGIAFGTFAGMMRILQGKHFLSDVVFAFFMVYAIAAITYDVFRRLGWLPVGDAKPPGTVAPGLAAVLRIIR